MIKAPSQVQVWVRKFLVLVVSNRGALSAWLDSVWPRFLFLSNVLGLHNLHNLDKPGAGETGETDYDTLSL